ncbi:MAG TPA: ABC transporter ATP-binding protein [Ktedonobacterales bacterium]
MEHHGPGMGRPRRTRPTNGNRPANGAQNGAHNGALGPEEDDGISLHQIIEAFRGVPRVLRLVWDVSHWLTGVLGGLYALQGLIPAATAWVAALLLNAVVAAIRHHGGAGTTTPVIWLAVAQFAVLGVSSLLSTLSNISQQLLQERVAADVQLRVMEKANTLDLAFFEDAKFYDTLQQAQREATSRSTGMISQTFGLGRTLVTFFSLFAILTHLAWWLALVALITPIPAFIAQMRYGWWGFQMMRRQSPMRREMAYYNTLLTTDTYNKEIKLFTLGDYFIKGYRTLFERYFKEVRGLIGPRYMAGFWWGLASLAGNALIYLYVALRAVANAIDLGAMTLYVQAATNLGGSFRDLLNGVSSLYENHLFINTLFDFLAYEPHITSPVNGLAPQGHGLTIEFRDVSFVYPGREEAGPALDHVSFIIRPGETVALVGRNGAGKTTIVKLLTRLYDPTEGTILVNGHDIREYDLDELRARIGVIFQDYVTYQLSAVRNIGVGDLTHIEDRSLVASAAAKSGADAVIEKLPDGYDTMLGKWFDQGQQLSGGEWQKVALARAFLRDADLLVLDEPTASLDPQAEYDVFARFRELTQGKSALFISHRFSTVRLASRIFVLEHGRLIQEGSHEELVTQKGRYAELFELQAEAYR